MTSKISIFGGGDVVVSINDRLIVVGGIPIQAIVVESHDATRAVSVDGGWTFCSLPEYVINDGESERGACERALVDTVRRLVVEACEGDANRPEVDGSNDFQNGKG